jgi:glycosyltransferase involved in cell wall biosynthesis
MKEKIKLLIAADTYYPKVDGTLRFMEEFMKRSINDFSISLLVPNLGSKKKNPKVKKLTSLAISKVFKISGYPNIKLSLKNIKLIKKSIKEADTIFIQGPALISYLSIYYGHRLKKKTVFYVHVISWELFEKFLPPIINKLFLKIFHKISIIFYNLCDEIFVPYNELKEQLKDNGVKTKMSVARLGVDIEFFSPIIDKKEIRRKLKLPENKFIIGYVGRISKEKNTQVLFKAFKKLEDQENLHLLIVGDGPKDEKERFSILKNCTITGFVDNVYDYMKAMDVFVMPSLTETTSLATLEAMSSGLPVIVSKVGFMKSYIIKGYNGVFFPRNSPTILAMKIKKIRENPEFRNKLSQNSRKTIIYSFSWERSINKIKRLLTKLNFSNN